MRKEFEKAEVEIIRFDKDDIVTTSQDAGSDTGAEEANEDDI